ncbi:hypothetical protein MRX96_016883 [Rhipicephalus microplus]
MTAVCDLGKALGSAESADVATATIGYNLDRKCDASISNNADLQSVERPGPYSTKAGETYICFPGHPTPDRRSLCWLYKLRP